MKPRHLIPALLGALLIANPLSLGPVAKWYYRNHPGDHAGPTWAAVLYAPLIWSGEHSETVETAFEWYFQLWGFRAED